LQMELQGIKGSFGYMLTRFYGSRIDRLLPDGTRRGELKRMLATAYRAAHSRGLRSPLHLLWIRIRKEESRIDEPMPGLQMEPLASSLLEEQRHVSPPAENGLVLCCDHPPLSEDTVACVRLLHGCRMGPFEERHSASKRVSGLKEPRSGSLRY